MDNHGIEELRAFYQAHRQELFAYACALLPTQEAAEDVVQAAFAQVLRRVWVPEELRPYLFRCVRNAALDELRRQGRRQQLPQDLPEPAGVLPGFSLEVREALCELSADERQAVVLKIYSGLTFQEIAAVHEVSINTAASWYRRGIEKLRRIMQEVTHE